MAPVGRSRFQNTENGLALLPPLHRGRHAPGSFVARPDYVYRPPATHDCVLSLERQETTRPAPVGVAEAERRRQADFRGQETCRYPGKRIEGSLVGALARRHGLAEDRFVVGNGIMNLLATVYSAFLRPGDRVVVPTPGFWPAYSFAVQRGVGVLMPRYRWGVADGARQALVFPEDELRQALQNRLVRLCYLCAPDNPTGHAHDPAWLREIVREHPHVLFVIDAAYWAYDHFERSATGSIRDGLATQAAAALVREEAPNVLGAFTFSKHYALANHRVGYLIGVPELVETVAYHLGPYGMSEIDLALAYYNLQNDAYAEENVRATVRNKRRLESALAELGVPFLSGAHNAIALQGPDWQPRLRKAGIAVRPLTYFEGIPNLLEDHVRFAVPTDYENTEFLLAALRRLAPAD